MPTLQVRDLPEDVYHRLRDRAESEHRSLAQETVVLLRDALGVRQSPQARRRTILDSLPTIIRSGEEPLPDPTELVRADRDR